jgi:hypothetical protein
VTRRFLALALVALGAFGLISASLALPADAAVTQTVISAADYPVGLAEDSAGNVYIADEQNRTLLVVPSSTQTLFGVNVTAGVEATIYSNSSSYPRGLAVSPAGDIYFAGADSNLYALTATNKTVFGVSVLANTPTVLASSWLGGSLDFDGSGNLFGIGITTRTIQVLPATTGTLFGVAVTANVRSVLLSNQTGWFWDLAVDPSGNILVADGWGVPGVYIFARQSGTYFGEAVTSATFTKINAFGSARRAGIDVDTSGNLFAIEYGNAVDVYSPLGQEMFGQLVAPATLTRLLDTAVGGVSNQGLLIASNGDAITGGGSATYRTVNYLLPSATPTPTATPAATLAPVPSTTPSNDGGLSATALATTGFIGSHAPVSIAAFFLLTVGSGLLLRRTSRP